MTKSDAELIEWFSAYADDITDIDNDFQDGLALLQFAERLTGTQYPKNTNPQTTEQKYKNVTIAFMAILNMFDGIDPVASVDEIVQGDPEKTRDLLHAISSDEWEVAPLSYSDEDAITPRTKEFNIEDCDLNSYPTKEIIFGQSLIRRYLCKNRVAKLSKKKKYRDNVAKEIQETEEHYVNCLRTLVEVYYHQLKFKADMAQQTGAEPILNMEELGTVFSNIVTIFEFNQKLLASISERIARWSYTQKLGDIFLEMAPFLSIYTQYCNNYETSITAVERLKKQKPLFASYLTESNLHLKQSQNYFESLLITPIQRGPRYALLLKELVSRTHEDHPDYQDLKNSIVAVEKQINSVNKKIRESQALNEVVAIQEKLVGDDIPVCTSLVSPSRFYISESSFKLCNLDSKGLSKEFETVHIFVFNDCLLYTKMQSTRAYKFRNLIPLSAETRLKDIPDMGVVQNAFKLISPEKTVSLVAHSVEYKKEWIDLFNKLQGDLLSKINQSETKVIQEGSLNANATITGTKKLYDKSGKSFTCYSILVTPFNGDKAYTVYRRYREFDAIWRTLRKKFPDCNLMQLPKKHIIGNMKKDIVESRQVMLETFLDDILTKPAICASSELFIFLQPSDNYGSTGGGSAIKTKKPKKKAKKNHSLASSAPDTSNERKRSSSVSLGNAMFRKSDSLAAASILESDAERKPLFVKKGTDTSNLTKLQKNKLRSSNTRRDVASGFIPVLPPVPQGHKLRSSTMSAPENIPTKNLASTQPMPKISSSSESVTKPRIPTKPPSDILSPRKTGSKPTRAVPKPQDDAKPQIPNKPSSTQDPRNKFAPGTRKAQLPSKKPPSLPPKPSDEELTSESKPIIPPKPSVEKPGSSSDELPRRSGSRIRTIKVDKKKMPRKLSNRNLPGSPAPSPPVTHIDSVADRVASKEDMLSALSSIGYVAPKGN